MKLLMILADGFEEIEALGTADVLRRLGVDVTLAGLTGRNVRGAHGIAVQAETLLKDADNPLPDGLILPGGMPGAQYLWESPAVLELVRRMNDAGKLLCAICAAPTVLAKAGVLTGKRFTMYPGFEAELNGLRPTSRMTECDGNVITGKGPGAVWAFARAIGEYASIDCRAAFQGMFVEC